MTPQPLPTVTRFWPRSSAAQMRNKKGAPP
nr:MAG TPA: hypothetical protein [Ackermannviridae sp.]